MGVNVGGREPFNELIKPCRVLKSEYRRGYVINTLPAFKSQLNAQLLIYIHRYTGGFQVRKKKLTFPIELRHITSKNVQRKKKHEQEHQSSLLTILAHLSHLNPPR